MNPIHAVYGSWPTALHPHPAAGVACSPLSPGARGLEEYADGSLSAATLYAPPGTLERRFLLAHALRALAIGAPLTAFAPKDKGGSRLAAELEAFGCPVVDTGRDHHRFSTTTRPALLHGLEEAINAGGPQLHSAHGLWTQPGIFSWDRLDSGTALLLTHLPSLRGVGADFGCGLGVLSQAALQSPEVSGITLLDIDRRAIAAAARNIRDPRAAFRWADIRQGSGLSTLDFVVMNPPFHDTGIEDKSLGLAFLTQAAAALRTGGTCYLTANRHLPYEALLAERFRTVTRLAEADGFKIFAAVK